jgi:hypothetical protein
VLVVVVPNRPIHIEDLAAGRHFEVEPRWGKIMCELESSTEVEGTLTIQTCHESFSIVGKAETKDINQKSRLSLSGGRCAFFPPGLWLIRIFNRCGVESSGVSHPFGCSLFRLIGQKVP